MYIYNYIYIHSIFRPTRTWGKSPAHPERKGEDSPWRRALVGGVTQISGVKLRGCWILGEYQIIYDYRKYYIYRKKQHHIKKRLSWWWRQLTTVRSHNAAASRIQEGEPTWGGRMPPASWLFVYGQMMQGFLRMPDPKVTMAFTTKSSNLDDFGVLPF